MSHDSLRLRATLLIVCLIAVASAHASAEEIADFIGKKYKTRDSLAEIEEPDEDAKKCLQGLVWPAAAFEVQCEEPARGRGDLQVRFPSPIATGDAVNDRVAMEWYAAQDETGRLIEAPAVVVVHESGSDMTVGRLFARGLRTMGLHALLIQLPHYGLRRSGREKGDAADVILRMRQGIADVRRARDAVAVLPLVDADHIGVQGTSLGGFVAANSAALDGAYDYVFLMLAGGDLYDLIENGEKDAAKIRARLKAAGLTGEKLNAVLWDVEPTRIAHRLDNERTWLYSGKYDKVVPPKNADALAKAARLDAAHHVKMAANHYSGVVYLPTILADVRKQIPNGHTDEPSAKRVTEKINLFNGRDLSGWTTWLVDEKRDDARGVFSVKDRMLAVSGDGFGYLATEQAYRDYRLVVEYKWGERNWRSRRGKARDSGIFLHAGGPDGNSYDADGAYKAGIECQIMEGATGDVMLIRGRDGLGRDIPLAATANVGERLDDGRWPFWQPDGKPRTLKLWGRINWRHKDAAWKDEFGFRGRGDVERPAGEWTRLECVCSGSRILVLVNGEKVNEVYDVFPQAGQILIQCEGSEIVFRRVELHPLGD